MRLAAILLVAMLPLAACSKKKHPGPPPRCVVKVQLPAPQIDGTKAPECSVALIAPDTTSFADVIAGMDAAAKAGFVDFGIGDVVSKVPPPSERMTASRTTSEGMIIGRFDGMVSAPVVVIAQNGDVSVGGNVVGKADDAELTKEVRAALVPPAIGSAAPPASIVISAHASQTYRAVYRVARAAADLGYASFLFSVKN